MNDSALASSSSQVPIFIPIDSRANFICRLIIRFWAVTEREPLVVHIKHVICRGGVGCVRSNITLRVGIVFPLLRIDPSLGVKEEMV